MKDSQRGTMDGSSLRLEQLRHERFVARHVEVDHFVRLLGAKRKSPSVLYVHGPGGIGKTSLLWELAYVARTLGAACCYLDARDVAPTRRGVQRRVAGALGVRPDVSLFEALAERGGGQQVILLDTSESLAELDEWLYDAFVAELPPRVLLVVASRNPPPISLHRCAAFGAVARTIALGGLGDAAARAFLDKRGVPAGRHDAVIAFAHGHPLAISILADLISSAPEHEPRPAPDMIHALVRQFIERAPSADHRAALDACALLRTTTEPVLASVLGAADATDIFDWLRRLSFIESGPRGLFPHDLAREVFIADLRWRNPARFGDLFARATRFYAARIGDVGAEDRELHSDHVFLQCHTPEIRGFFDWRRDADLTVGPMTGADIPHIVAMVASHEGPESAAIVERWLTRAPEGVLVVRDGLPCPAGLDLTLPIEVERAGELGEDPGAAAILRFLERRAPLRPGERGMLVRSWMTRDGYQDAGPVSSLIRTASGQRWAAGPGLSCAFFTFADPSFWAPLAAHFGMARLPDADFTVGGRSYGVFGCDMRVAPLREHFADLARKGAQVEAPPPAAHPADPGVDRAVTAGRSEPTEPAMGTTAPGQSPGPERAGPPPQAFVAAVRDALRNVQSPRALSKSPLIDDPLVARRAAHGAGAAARAAILARLLRQGIEGLHGGPRDERLHRVLEVTYLQSEPTQEQAAAKLRLPFSTYRRHLGAAIAALATALWEDSA